MQLSQNNRIRVIQLSAPRGKILDRNGKVVAGNRVRLDCVIMPQEFIDKENGFSRLSSILGMPEDVLKKRFNRRLLNPFTPVVLAPDISKENAITIEEERFNMPGVFINANPIRDYVYKDAAAQLVGYIGEIGQKELDKLDRYGYRVNDLVGRSGIEEEYDNYLRGEDGGMQIEVDSKGKQNRVLGLKEPKEGRDVYLTVDIELQKYISELFGEGRGACVVMNPANGEILSLVSKPSFDPNVFVVPDNFKIKEILSGKSHPMLDRAISCAYPPGSIFKIAVATAALEERKLSTDREFICNGKFHLGNQVFDCWKENGHGPQNVINALKNSCNVFFYNTGMLLGPDLIAKYSQKFGFGRPTGIDLPQETSGLVPNKLWKRIKMGETWYNGETANYGIGQGYLLTTPIQVLGMTAAVANGGFLVRPHIVKRIASVDISAGSIRKLGISDNSLDVVTTSLRKVVEDDNGTGVKARVKGLSIAGKTGTAQTGRGTTHAWFVGFSPVDKPKVALVVLLEEGGKGGLNAAIMGGKIFKKAQELGLL